MSWQRNTSLPQGGQWKAEVEWGTLFFTPSEAEVRIQLERSLDVTVGDVKIPVFGKTILVTGVVNRAMTTWELERGIEASLNAFWRVWDTRATVWAWTGFGAPELVKQSDTAGAIKFASVAAIVIAGALIVREVL